MRREGSEIGCPQVKARIHHLGEIQALLIEVALAIGVGREARVIVDQSVAADDIVEGGGELDEELRSGEVMELCGGSENSP